MMGVLITGGAGYIGSHTTLALIEAGYDVLLVDDFRNSKPEALDRISELAGRPIPFIEADVCDKDKVEEIFANNEIDAVIHFAGLKAVGESVAKPLMYYRNNLVSTLNILDSMRAHNVLNFVFSSTATVYGDPETVPVNEESTLQVTNPYARTKLMIEDILRDLYRSEPDFNIAILRYFNPIGAHKSGRIGEDPFGTPNNLLPYVAQVAVGRLKEVSVFGNDYETPDGTGVRDYIHVLDLADGHVAALKKLETGCGLITYNLGTGKGYSVLDVIHAFSKACGKELPYRFVERRAGDVAEYYADPTKARVELGWQAKYDLDEMCADTWRWQSMNPNGYVK